MAMRHVLLALFLGACTGSASPDGGTIFTLGDGGPCSGPSGSCTVDDLCPCIAPWESHAEYVLCVERAHALLGTDGGTSVASAESNACGRCNGPVAELFMPAGTTTVPRAFTTIAVLADGTVLVAGGEAIDIVNTSGPPDAGTTRITQFLASADRYDPIVNRFAPTGSLITARGSATATTLQNGKVLVVGGSGNGVDQLASAELYDPTTGTFSATGALNQERTIHTATLLADGRVLISGGYSTTNNAGAPLPDTVLASGEIYDPTAGTFTTVGSMATARNRHSATLLGDGTVLIAGGHNPPLGDLATAERFNPTTGMFTATGSLIEGRRRHGAALLANGSVLIAGGTDGTAQITTAEIYTPSSGTFASTGPLGIPREDLAALTLPDGQALFIGGDNASGELASAELYDPNAGVFFATGGLAVGREFPVAALLPGGDVLVTGGDNAIGALDDAELYQPVCQAFVPDGGAPIVSDMITPPDLATPDLAMISIPDLAMPDLATPHDLSVVSTGDMTVGTTAPLCSSDHWCWDNPLPTGNIGQAQYSGAWGAGPNAWWFAGDSEILYWNGSQFSTVWTGPYLIERIIGFSTSDVWAVGMGLPPPGSGTFSSVILHWDGTTWTSVSHPAVSGLTAIWGAASNDMWATSIAGNALLHWNGSAWSSVTPPLRIEGLWGASVDDVWAVGAPFSGVSPSIYHWNGSSWTGVATSFTPGAWLDVWGTSSTDVWVIGGNGGNQLAHWDGTTWTATQLPWQEAGFSVWAAAPNDAWATSINTLLPWTVIVRHWDGTAWSVVNYGPTNRQPFELIRGTASNDVFTGGPSDLLHWNGTSWSELLTSFTTNDTTFLSVWGESPSDVWAVGDVIAHRDGTGWKTVMSPTTPPPPGRETWMQSVWGASSSDVWAVGYLGAALHWNGSAWSPVATPSTTTLLGVSGCSSTDVWAVSAGSTIIHWNGTQWSFSPVAGSLGLTGVWCNTATDAWAVGSLGGSNGIVLHWNGTAWSQSTAAAYPLSAVSGSASNNVWAGGNHELMHWNGSAWTSVALPGLSAAITSLWSRSPTEVWAIDNGGAMLSWDGTALTPQSLGATVEPNARAVWGFPQGGEVAVGAYARVWRKQ